MDQTQIIAAVTSLPFIPACIALVRKFFPTINGKVVNLIALLLSAGSVALVMCAADIPRWGWIVLACVAGAVLPAGGTAYLDRGIDRMAGLKTGDTRPEPKS